MHEPRSPGEQAAGLAQAPGSFQAPCTCGDPACECGGSDDRDVMRAMAAAAGLEPSTAEELLPLTSPVVARGLSRRYLERARLLPLSDAGGRILVATCNPRARIEDLVAALDASGYDLRLVTPTDYRRLRLAIDLGRVVVEPSSGAFTAAGPAALDVSATTVVDAHVVQLFSAILLDAVGARASDVHLERYGDTVRVRMRVDGNLHDVTHFDVRVPELLGIVNLVKIRADLDISERRLPQGGRFSMTAGGRSFDLRAQTQPALFGEHVVNRLLPHSVEPLAITGLGFPDDVARQFRRILDSPQGLLLVVGPTGSGKTTTLYAGLHVLARDPTRKVMTVEDPIEYALPGIQQSQVRPEIGFAFSHAMRAFVRQDPDVVLVGEIRDPETALEALRASETGHLVLSTLHCNDAVDALQRVRDLGMHPNAIASELLAVIAQRLARRLCDACREPAVPPQDLVEEVFPNGVPAGFRCFRARGCPRCDGLGSRGRTAIAELLPAGPELRRAIWRGASTDDLRAVARAQGMRPLRDHALQRVAEGLIAFDELRDLLPPERLAPQG